jgi:hypothetical protein
MPQGTPFDRTEALVARLLASLAQAQQLLPAETQGDTWSTWAFWSGVP